MRLKAEGAGPWVLTLLILALTAEAGAAPLCDAAVGSADEAACRARFTHSLPPATHDIIQNTTSLDVGHHACLRWDEDGLPAVSQTSGWGGTIAFHGERDCGTNFFTRLVQLNVVGWRAGGNKTIWKHSCGAPVASLASIGYSPSTHVVAIGKNPYAWLLSLYKSPHNDSPEWSHTWGTKMRGESRPGRASGFAVFLRTKFW